MHPWRVARTWGLAVLFGSTAIGAAPGVCRINLVERGSGWPVPLVELRTTHQVRLVSDNAGVIALDLPECLGRETWFEVTGHGYEVPRDGFGYRGVRLTPRAGQVLTVELQRTILARRLGRITGGGLFAESQRLGGEADWRESGVFGCDSVQLAEYRGKLFWVWGDTTLPHYPLGVFHATSAVTPLPPLIPREPPVRVQFDYFRDDRGRPRGVARMPGEGPTWVSALAVLAGEAGRDRLVGTYAKVKGYLDVYEYGLCAWNDTTECFEQVKVIWRKSASSSSPPLRPDGHAAIATDADGIRWVYFGNPLPRLRCRATVAAWQDPTQWEELHPPETLPAAGQGAAVKIHSGSIAWHPWRQRWVTVFVEAHGRPSALGEVWYAEAGAPTGPWGPATKVLSHENYTFYNPCIHAELLAGDSPALVFEGTFTREFADRPPATARADYNQVLYRVDLDDPRLAPPR